MKDNLARNTMVRSQLDFVGDHLAINLINTRRMSKDGPTDILQSDDDVKTWLKRLEVPVSKGEYSFAMGELLERARELREIAFTAIEERKAGKKPSLIALNRFLERAPSHTALHFDPARNLSVTRIYGNETAEGVLAPVAEAVADLLANANFDLVRHCEGEGCVLWFYDQTKGHRRRWCTATGCGNRAKVAAFRARATRSK